MLTNVSQDVSWGGVPSQDRFPHIKTLHSAVLIVGHRAILVNKRETNLSDDPIKTVDGQRFNRS
jgi:hypothetical protein